MVKRKRRRRKKRGVGEKKRNSRSSFQPPPRPPFPLFFFSFPRPPFFTRPLSNHFFLTFHSLTGRYSRRRGNRRKESKKTGPPSFFFLHLLFFPRQLKHKQPTKKTRAARPPCPHIHNPCTLTEKERERELENLSQPETERGRFNKKRR